nr:immunoglobulin light chain junction region [Macaca mulatta]MOW57120.1 immunoglobulin light chain junction region [Macaca mulatta]MOW57759.1 immunoglobulin light chain junction region [Macaca mulatta]MOW57978.1 immunoglobulin light chain junction region [Macaca mulatta]MOW58762.1 immunoglobulin light chain junction region [Macaca mulatta]
DYYCQSYDNTIWVF